MTKCFCNICFVSIILLRNTVGGSWDIKDILREAANKIKNLFSGQSSFMEPSTDTASRNHNRTVFFR